MKSTTIANTFSFSDLYDLKCTIARTLFLGCHDWEDRIEMTVINQSKTNYVRFKANQISINIGDDGKISVCGLIRKPLIFNHENITDTLSKIQTELVAHRNGEI